MADLEPFIITNSLPASLIRRSVKFYPRDIETLRQQLSRRPFFSVWGHNNTLMQVNGLLQVDITPDCERPSLGLDPDKYPCYQGRSFKECWIMSPDILNYSRSDAGREHSSQEIIGWQPLQVLWR